MSNPELVPYGRDGQRWVTREWESAVQRRGGSLAARAVVRDSWERSIDAAVPADLARAPIVMAGDTLHLACERADWVPFAQRAAAQLPGAFASGHILSLFDAEGRMLACQGDPRALEGLGGINFRPGALWTESAVGTNGPGTALATGRPVHIVGAEHFCETLHQWHCAAVPVRDQTTHEVLGVIDISGLRDHAHPHTLELAVALAASVEQMLTAREAERRYAVLHRLAELTTSYGAEALVAVDRGGRVLYATPATPAGLRPDTVAPEALRAAIASHLRSIDGDGRARDVLLELYEDVGLTAVSHPVLDGRTAVGTCLLLRTGTAARTARAVVPTPPAASPAVVAVSRPRPGAAPPRYSFFDVIGGSPQLAAACRIATAAASNALPVLIVGESGTGKEVFAQAIHEGSARRDRPFVAVNCAALPRELVESELFGYVGGAFSGARREGSPGKFQAAHGGTIFLDEIGELPATAQATLLRVLQEGEITAVGSAHSKALDVRVIAATNRDMPAALASGQMRSDLYYRLNVLSIELPPLRERLADVPDLAHHFLDAAGLEVGRPGLALAPAVIELFQRYAWPGNVREMKNLIRRLAALASGPTITADDLPPAIARGDAPVPRGAAVAAAAPAPGDDPERARTIAAVSTARTMAEAAARLGVTRSTLYRRLERYGVHPERLLHTH